MCGVAGIANLCTAPLSRTKEEFLSRLLQRLAHRGPDGSGQFKIEDVGVLGATRLAIVDRYGAHASMPIVSTDRKVALVMNGEIYNHLGLRKKLQANYNFQSDSDSEVALAAYLLLGEEFVKDILGMFAIIIVDAHKNQTIAYVDRIGEKPLYMYQTSEYITFASELAALVKDEAVSVSYDRPSIIESTLFRFCQTGSTPYREIRRLSPGEIVKVSRDGTVQSRKYWMPASPSSIVSAVDADSMRFQAEQSCLDVLQTEEPLGVLLSGGLDSTIVTHFACQRGNPVHTFSIGFKPESWNTPSNQVPLDEFKYSRFVASHYKTNHHEIQIGSDDYWDSYEDWICRQLDPLGVEEAPCLMHLFKAIKPYARIVACGSGPDEVLEGYGHAERIGAADLSNPRALLTKYLQNCSWYGSCDPVKLMPTSTPIEDTVNKLLPILSQYIKEARSVLDSIQYINAMTRLHSYELRQMDLASMAYGIEARSPLVDFRFIEKALSCTAEQKSSAGVRKRILVEAFKNLLPSEVINRKKEGFPIAVYLLYSPRFCKHIEKLLKADGILASLDFLDFKYLRELWSDGSIDSRMIFFRILTMERVLGGISP